MLLAYGKLELKREIVASDAPDDPFFEGLLEGYFPKADAQVRRADAPPPAAARDHRHRASPTT